MAVGGLAAPLTAEAQQAGKMWRVGFLAFGARPPDGAPPPALRQALQEYGTEISVNPVYGPLGGVDELTDWGGRLRGRRHGGGNQSILEIPV